MGAKKMSPENDLKWSKMFILSTFLGPLYGKNTQPWTEFWNSIFKKKKKKKKKANKSRLYYLSVKKTSCVSLSTYIFPCLAYKMKDEINSQIAFPQMLKKYSLTLYAI